MWRMPSAETWVTVWLAKGWYLICGSLVRYVTFQTTIRHQIFTEGNFREFYARTLCTRKLRALLKNGETNTKKNNIAVLFIFNTEFQFNYTEQLNDLSF